MEMEVVAERTEEDESLISGTVCTDFNTSALNFLSEASLTPSKTLHLNEIKSPQIYSRSSMPSKKAKLIFHEEVPLDTVQELIVKENERSEPMS